MKKDLPDKLDLDQIIQYNAYPSLTSESNDTYYPIDEESPADNKVDEESSTDNHFQSGLTVLAMSSHYYTDLTINWLRSIETLHVYPNITVITTDDLAYDQLSSFLNLHLIRTKITETPDVKRNHKSYANTKWRVVLDMLTHNQDVLISDVDMVWLENPFPYLSDNPYDMFISWDPMGKFCPGFMFLRSTPNTVEFVNKFITKLPNASSDTALLNSMISAKTVPQLQYQILDPYKFISGRYYFNEDWRTYHSDVTPVIVHSNGINISTKDSSSTHGVKIDLFKKHGLWYLNGNARLTWEAGTASIADDWLWLKKGPKCRPVCSTNNHTIFKDSLILLMVTFSLYIHVYCLNEYVFNVS